MVRRVTITLDPNLVSTIRNLQAKQMAQSNKAISFSSMINQILKKGLKEISLENLNNNGQVELSAEKKYELINF